MPLYCRHGVHSRRIGWDFCGMGKKRSPFCHSMLVREIGANYTASIDASGIKYTRTRTNIIGFLRDAFLPINYPASVSSDYATFVSCFHTLSNKRKISNQWLNPSFLQLHNWIACCQGIFNWFGCRECCSNSVFGIIHSCGAGYHVQAWDYLFRLEGMMLLHNSKRLTSSRVH